MAAGASYLCDGDVIEIVLHRPERRNALGAAEWAVLDAAIADAAGGACDIVVLRGEGDVFCAGADLDWIEQRSRAGSLLGLIESNGATLRRFERLPQIFLVALNGPALGIGAHLALCADVVLATRASYLCMPEAKLGIPDVMHFGLLEQRLGRSAAIDMTLLGRRLTAEEAVTQGVVGQLCEDPKALQRAVGGYLERLRMVDPAVRRAVKAAAGIRADAALQRQSCEAVMTRAVAS